MPFDDFSKQEEIPCDWPGCTERGNYPAPHSPRNLSQHYYFCLSHIRAYNSQWNFFAHLDPEEILQFKIDAISGHRPTWKMGVYKDPSSINYRDYFDLFTEGPSSSTTSVDNFITLPLAEQNALKIFALTLPLTQQDVKKRYKELVKQYHPDLNKDNPHAEEHFKRIVDAYSTLIKSPYIPFGLKG